MSEEQYTIAPDFQAFAMPQGAPDGGPSVHMTMRRAGLIMELVVPLGEARKAYVRLGEALRTFDVARELAEVRSDQQRLVPASDHASREHERRYRAKLAVRLGLASDDIRAVFDLSEDELTRLRAEVAGS